MGFILIMLRKLFYKSPKYCFCILNNKNIPLIFPKREITILFNRNNIKTENEMMQFEKIFNHFEKESKDLKIPIRQIKGFLLKNENLQNNTKLNLLTIWLKKTKSEKEFIVFLEFLEMLNTDEISKEFINLLMESILKFYDKISSNELLRFLRYKYKIIKVVSLFNMNKFIIHKLQYEEKNILFDFMVEINFFSNNYILNLELENELYNNLERYDKNLLFEIFNKNSIFFNENLTEYFKDQFEKKETENKQIEKINLTEIKNFKNSQMQNYLNKSSLQTLLYIKKNPETYKNYIPSSLIEKKISDKLDLENNNIKHVFRNIEYFLKNKKYVTRIIIKTDNFLNCLNTSLFEFTSNKDFFFQIIFIYSNFLKNSENLYSHYSISENSKNIIEAFLKRFEELFIDTFFEESINENLYNQEEIQYMKETMEDIIYNIKEKNLNEEEFEKIIEFYELINKANIGQEIFFKKFGIFFSFYLNRLSEKHFNRVIRVACDLNFFSDLILKEIEGIILDRKNNNNGLLNYKLDTLINLSYLFLINNDYENQFWIDIDNNFKDFEDLNNLIGEENKMILFFAQKILKKHNVNFLKNIEFTFNKKNIILENENFFEELKFYFKFLFLENIEQNKKINFININYSQGKKILLLLERKYVTGFTGNQKGIIKLTTDFLSFHYDKVQVYPITTFQEFEKRNEKMHELRKKLNGWNIDYECRENYYDKAYDVDFDKVG